MPVLLAGVIAFVVATVQAPRPCPAPSEPDTTWHEALFVGLDLKLRLPADLRPVPFGNLGSPSRRNEELGIPRLVRDSARLIAAWERSGRGPGDFRGVYLYQMNPGTQPRGRGCALPIAGHGGLVLRHIISGDNRDQDQHWTEGAWAGFVLAAHGTSPGSFERALRIFGGVAPIR